MNIGDVFTISDGNGGTIRAKITDRLRNDNGRLLPRILFRTRKGNHGRFAAKETEMSIKKFKALQV